MGQSIYCIPNSNAGCALSVQKIYFITQVQKQLYILPKPFTGKDFPRPIKNPLLARVSALATFILYTYYFDIFLKNLTPCGFGLIGSLADLNKNILPE